MPAKTADRSNNTEQLLELAYLTHTSSSYQRTFSFFASQTLHNIKNLKKKDQAKTNGGLRLQAAAPHTQL